MSLENILILGGTGAMGCHLVDILTDRGITVHVTSRKICPNRPFVTYVQGNAHDWEFIQTLLYDRHWNVIVDFMVYTTAEFERRVKTMLSATEQYIYLSSARVYADTRGPITEKSPRLLDVSMDAEYLKTDEYALSKARQEDVLRQSEKRNWTIIRPYITYSESRLQLGVLEKESWLYRALHGRSIVFSDDISVHTTTLTYGFDVANGIASIIGNKQALGETFHITTEKSLCWDEILQIYEEVLMKHLGRRPGVIFTKKSSNLSFGKYQVVYDRMYDRTFDTTHIKKFIDTSSFLNPNEGLRRCLSVFLQNPKFDSIDWRAEACRDRISGEWASMCEIPTLKQKIKYLLYRAFGLIN
jgi:nucleoside-diphosphate-sugar epimerase